VTLVRQGSSADKDGFKPKDELLSVEGQYLTSIADLQWILHNAGEKKGLKAVVGRGGEKAELTLSLPPGWRRAGDMTWRSSTWDLRRMATGGLVLQDVNNKEREKLGLGAEGMALRITHVGQFGEHAAGRNAGFQKNDVVVSFDGKAERLTEAAVLAYAVESRRRGDRIDVTVLRGDKKVTLKLPQQ
jgi:S1-C subfamily serine protease